MIKADNSCIILDILMNDGHPDVQKNIVAYWVLKYSHERIPSVLIGIGLKKMVEALYGI